MSKGNRLCIVWEKNGKPTQVEMFKNIKSKMAALKMLRKINQEHIYIAVYFKDSVPEILKQVK